MQQLALFMRAVFALVLVFCGAAGAAANERLAQGFTALPAGARVIVMPMDVELFSMSAGGVLEPQAEWTTLALDNLRRAIRSRPTKNGAVLDTFQGEPDLMLDDFNRLHGAIGSAINIHHLGPLKLPTKEGRLEWSLGPEVSLIKQKTGADYALFTFIRDSYASNERKAAIVIAAAFGVGLSAGVQVGYASLVDLSTGDVVWFNRLIRGYGDLRELDNAKESLDALLQSFPG